MILKKCKLFSIVVCMITVLSVLSLMIPRNVSADGNDKSLTLTCVHDDILLAGMQWKIYKVGQRTNGERQFVQTGDFAGVQISMRRMTSESIQQAAQTFQAYAIASGIEPLYSGETDEYGEIQFSGLSSGLYLISGKTLKIGSHYYQPTTVLVELKDEDSNLKYNAFPKVEYEVMNEQPRAHTVYKEWVGDEEHLENRPEHITVELYKDEEYYQTVILNAENRWRYRWVDPDHASWIVIEKEIPEYYEMTIEYETNYRIQNSYTDEFITTTIPGNTSTGTSTSTSISVQQTNTDVSTTTTTASSVMNLTVSRTRTTTSTDVTDNSVTNTHTTTATTNNVESGAATGTNNTSTRSENASATTTGSAGSTGSTGSSHTTTTRNNGGGSGNGGGNSGGNSGGKLNYSNNGSSGSTKLPQTGQLWWPIVPLSIGGVLCVSAGFAIRTRRKSDD